MITIAEINTLPSLVNQFGDIAEHAPWVAEMAAASRPFGDRNAMITAFQQAVMNADRDRQLALIRAHPDLAGKAQLTKDSAREQAGAGLDTLSQKEFEQFTRLNTAYREKIGFPFIFAVKGADKHAILENFEKRLPNSPQQEFETALEMVCRIIRFRLEDKVAP